MKLKYLEEINGDCSSEPGLGEILNGEINN